MAHELDILHRCTRLGLPVLLKGPTGCGKTRLVEALAHELQRSCITVACNEETSAVDLLGRWLVQGGETVWQDGPATRAARTGAILYLDEVAEAREDVIVVLHSLADHRRQLFLDRHDETIHVAPGFQLIASFNPGYRRGPKDLKPSTRQRFVAIALGYAAPEIEARIVAAEGGLELKQAQKLVKLARKVRQLPDAGLAETASTRLLIAAARLIAGGMPPRQACRVAVVEPLSDDAVVCSGLSDLVDLAF